ncbi:hypothetical protein [Arthrobacter pityocampae]|uniref:hypothetical protein n=1 Tax=Arthrobacter pityocampae TaxID=547334 RepID=UPI003736C339
MNIDAWDKAETLEVVLKGWGQALAEALYGFSWVKPGDPRPWATRLLDNIQAVRGQEWAGDLAYELRASINECQHATDRAADRITLGECGNLIGDVVCLGTVRSTVGASLGRCGECRAVYDVRERQQWMISEAWHVTGFLPDVVRWLDRAGHAKLNVQKVKNWVHKGRLESCGVAEGRPLYTPAAVMAAYRETPTGRIPTTERGSVAC